MGIPLGLKRRLQIRRGWCPGQQQAIYRKDIPSESVLSHLSKSIYLCIYIYIYIYTIISIHKHALYIYIHEISRIKISPFYRVLVGLADKVGDLDDIGDLGSAPGLNGSIGSICFAVLPIFATSGGMKTWKKMEKYGNMYGKSCGFFQASGLEQEKIWKIAVCL